MKALFSNRLFPIGLCTGHLAAAVSVATLIVPVVSAQTHVLFSTDDGATISANLYGSATRGLVLAHGGRFSKESWTKQVPQFVAAGFRVLAFDFRAADSSDAELESDVMAAVHYLHQHGAKTVSIVGGSMGGSAAGDASIASSPGEIDRLVLLGAAPNGPANKLKSPTLFIVAREDTSGDGPRLPGIRAQYKRAPQPKKLVVLDGSAHAQYLFQTDQADRVMREILEWLKK